MHAIIFNALNFEKQCTKLQKNLMNCENIYIQKCPISQRSTELNNFDSHVMLMFACECYIEQY